MLWASSYRPTSRNRSPAAPGRAERRRHVVHHVRLAAGAPGGRGGRFGGERADQRPRRPGDAREADGVHRAPPRVELLPPPASSWSIRRGRGARGPCRGDDRWHRSLVSGGRPRSGRRGRRAPTCPNAGGMSGLVSWLQTASHPSGPCTKRRAPSTITLGRSPRASTPPALRTDTSLLCRPVASDHVTSRTPEKSCSSAARRASSSSCTPGPVCDVAAGSGANTAARCR